MATKHFRKPRRSNEEKSHWPAWFYGPDGKGAIFNGPLEVPEGWHDSPDKVGNDKAKTVIPGYEEAVAQLKESGDEEHEERLQAGQQEQQGDAPGNEGGDEGQGSQQGDEKEQEVAPLPPIDKIGKKDIIVRLNRAKVNFNPTWSEQRLYDMLKDHLSKGE